MMRNISTILIFLLVGALLVGSASAYDYEETLEVFSYEDLTVTATTPNLVTHALDDLRFTHIEEFKTMRYFEGRMSTSYVSNSVSSGQRFEVEYLIGATVVGTGHYGSWDNEASGYTYIWCDFDTWDVSAYTGAQTVTLQKTGGEGSFVSSLRVGNYASTDNSPYYVTFWHITQTRPSGCNRYQTFYTQDWKNEYTVDKAETVVDVSVTRSLDGKIYGSIIELKSDLTQYIYDTGTTDYTTSIVPDSYPLYLNIRQGLAGSWFNRTLYSDAGSGSTTATVTLYARAADTGALLANSHATFTEIATGTSEAKTLPSGAGSFTINPLDPGEYDITYWVNISASGYVTHNGTYSFWANPDPLSIYLSPSTSPGDPDYVYARFYVSDGVTGNPLEGAVVTVSGLSSKSTNSAGSATFEVNKSADYNYVISKTDYVTTAGTFNLEYNADFPIFIYHISAIPTQTIAPGSTPTPDTRTNAEKADSAIDMIHDNIEGIVGLAILVTILGLTDLMSRRRR